MLGSSLHDRIRRYFIVENHCFPVIRIALRAHNSALSLLIPFLKQFEKDLDFTLICNRVEQEGYCQ